MLYVHQGRARPSGRSARGAPSGQMRESFGPDVNYVEHNADNFVNLAQYWLAQDTTKLWVTPAKSFATGTYKLIGRSRFWLIWRFDVIFATALQ
jgi:hypothetical protein